MHAFEVFGNKNYSADSLTVEKESELEICSWSCWYLPYTYSHMLVGGGKDLANMQTSCRNSRIAG